MCKIGIVHYNMGNIASVLNAVSACGFNAEVFNNPDDAAKYDKIILPGVGAFPDAMKLLKTNGMDEAIKEYVKNKYLLGICLGMQLLFDKSYEHEENQGLGLIGGDIIRFQEDISGKIPQMGWNKINIKKNSQLLSDIKNSSYLYFVHSYYAVVKNANDILATTNYGIEFCSMVQRENIFGIQPHPEKSGEIGLKILKNFLEIK